MPLSGKGSKVAGLSKLQHLRQRLKVKGEGSHKMLVYLLKNIESDQSLIGSKQYEVLISTSRILIVIQLRLQPV